MLLKPMRFKDYTWPHNPEIYAVEYRRQIAAHKIPLGGWYLQDLGRTYRIFRGEGTFAGERAYEEFQTLAEVFDQTGPGLLVHPVWRTVSAYFVTLELMEEPKRDDGRRIVIDGTSPILSCTLREDHYDVLTDVQVKAPAEVEMDVSAELAVREGADFSAVKAAAEQALASFFSGRRLGGPVLLAELGDLLYHVEGVENYRLLAPAADLAAEDGTLPMLGRVTVTEMEADDDV